MISKICVKCQIEKEVTQFRFRRDSGKYRNECTSCLKLANRDYLNKRKESVEFVEKDRKRMRAYRETISEDKRLSANEQSRKLQQSKRDADNTAYYAEHGISREEARKKGRLENFIAYCTQLHRGKYSYEEILSLHSKKKIKIFCKQCTTYFLQLPPDHKNGKGCKQCGFTSTGDKLRSSCEDFKQKVIALFGDKYDLSKVEYVNNITKVTIGCSSHGDFKIRPANLLSGRGCPYCAKHGFQRNKSGNLYVLQCGNMTKVGITNNSVAHRVKQISRSSGKSFIIAHQLHLDSGEELFSLEQQLLSLLSSSYKQPTEIFDGYTECFYDVNIEDLLSKIEQHKGNTWKTTT